MPVEDLASRRMASHGLALRISTCPNLHTAHARAVLACRIWLLPVFEIGTCLVPRNRKVGVSPKGAPWGLHHLLATACRLPACRVLPAVL